MNTRTRKISATAGVLLALALTAACGGGGTGTSTTTAPGETGMTLPGETGTAAAGAPFGPACASLLAGDATGTATGETGTGTATGAATEATGATEGLPGQTEGATGGTAAPTPGAANISTLPVADALASLPAFSTFTDALRRAELTDTLNQAQDVTIFVPTNEAFAKIPRGDLDNILANKEQLKELLSYHVVNQRVTPDQMANGTFPSMQGGELRTAGGGEAFTVNGANVVCGNLQASNATIYAVDTVLMPTAVPTGTGTGGVPGGATAVTTEPTTSPS